MEIKSLKKIRVQNRPWGANVDEQSRSNCVRISGEGAVQVLNVSYQIEDEELRNAENDLCQVLFAEKPPLGALQKECQLYLPLKQNKSPSSKLASEDRSENLSFPDLFMDTYHNILSMNNLSQQP